MNLRLSLAPRLLAACVLASAAVAQNQNPYCDDGGNFVVACAGATTTAQVTTNAFDPDGDPLTYQWLSCPKSWITDPTAPTTDVIIDTSESCDRQCGVRLRLTDPFGGHYVCRLYILVTPGGEGCTPGYWRNHPLAWGDTGYAPGDDFDAVFGVDAFDPDLTLMNALRLGGGGLNKLARMGVAALLNASDGPLNGDVHFALAKQEVLDLVYDAITSGQYEPLATQLDTYNNGGCPQN
jgi:hypothetical protein